MSMRLTRSFLRPIRSGGAAATAYFFRRRRRLRSNGSSRRSSSTRASPFFTSIGRKRGGAAAENPEPSSPKVTCIGQVRVKSQKKVKQCRRRINGEASFRSAAEPSFQHQQRRSRRDQRWVHLPSLSAVLRALGREFCCFFRCCGGCDCCTCRCNCSCFPPRERACGRWCGGGGRRSEIDGGGGGDEEVVVMLDTNSRRHVFDDIEVKGDLIEVKGRSFFDGEEGFAISIPPKNALLLMRCRSDPIKMAAIANRISSDTARYENFAIDVEDDDDHETTSSDEVFEARVLEQEEREMLNQQKSFTCNEQKVDEIEQELNEDEEEVESNMSSFEALLETENYQDCQNKEVEAKSEENVDNRDPAAVQEDDKQEKEEPPPALPEKEAPAALPDCLLLMMREPKLSMEVSKETWVCATDFIRLHPERPRRAAAKATGDHEAPVVVKRRAAVEKSKPRVPPPAPKKNEAQPARSSCSLPAAAGSDRKRVGACEPIELTRCKSEPMSTAAAKLMPEAGCWKENVEMEPHRQASLGVSAAPAGVGC